MSRFVRAALGALILPLLLAPVGCGESAGGSGVWAGEVRDSAGIAIVTNPGAGMWTQDARWVLEEELRIGVETGDPELQFGSVVGLDADDDGLIYVLDGQAQRIRVFDADGSLLRAFGRPGAGPGELGQIPGVLGQSPGGIFLASDGGILVPDLMNQRITRFSPEGEPAGSAPLDFSGGFPIAWSAATDRTLYQQVRRMAFPGQAPLEGGPMDFILARGADGTVVDTTATMAAGESFSFGGAQPEIRLFAPESVWAVTGDGRLVTGLNSEYSLHVHGPAGEVTTILRRSFSRRPVTTGEIEGFRGAIRRAWVEAGVPAEAVGQLAQTIVFEDAWPALARLLGGPDGSLWVQRVDPETALDLDDFADLQTLQVGSPAWDVFDADGRYLGVVETPVGVTPGRFVGDRLYALHMDDLGVQRVVRYRVARSGG